MIETSVREFHIKPKQYQLFRFTIRRPTMLYIRLWATAPVDLFLLDNEGRADYERGEAFPYRATWGRRRDLIEEVEVESGTWYLVVEGKDEPSTGHIEVYQQ